jgi:hypothetical protein
MYIKVLKSTYVPALCELREALQSAFHACRHANPVLGEGNGGPVRAMRGTGLLQGLWPSLQDAL